MRGIHRVFAGVLLLAGMLAGTNAYGQGGATGAISGVVVDTSGGSIAAADIQIIDSRTESIVRKVATNTRRDFRRNVVTAGELHRGGEQIWLCGSESHGHRSAGDGNDARNDHAEAGRGLGKGGNFGAGDDRRNQQRNHRPISRHGYNPGTSAGNTELPATSDAFERRAERTERRGAAWQRQRETLRERTARG